MEWLIIIGKAVGMFIGLLFTPRIGKGIFSSGSWSASIAIYWALGWTLFIMLMLVA